jgi:hypothetical protein
MKNCLLLISSILFFCSLSAAQEDSFDDFRRVFNHRDGVHCFTIPGFLVRLAGNIALQDESRLEQEALRPLIRNISSMSVMVSEDDSAIRSDDILRLTENLEDENYELLTRIRDQEDLIQVFSWSKNDTIRRLFVIVHESDDETVLLQLRGRFAPEDIEEMINKMEKSYR